jgi:hypothetical protein
MPLILAVVNSERDSLEVWRWVDDPEERILESEKSLEAIATRLYLKLVSDVTNHQPGLVAAGHSEEPRPRRLKGNDKIHYALYEGKCLDPERFSYFLPDRTIKEGTLTEAEIRKMLAK